MRTASFDPGAYDVERKVFGGKFATHFNNPDGLALADQRALVERLVEHFEIDPIPVRRRGGALVSDSYASHDPRRITFGALAGPAIVAHEVAHVLIGAKHGHDAEWRQQYVACVRVILGDYHADRLAKAFAAFEDTMAKNKARGARKRGQRRSALKSGPRVRTVVQGTVEVTYKRRIGKLTMTHAKPHWRIMAIRYTTNKGGYWMVSIYEALPADFRAYENEWELLAQAKHPTIHPTHVEKRFSTQIEALEWGVLWCQERVAA